MTRLIRLLLCLVAAGAMNALTATIGAAAANPYRSAEAPAAHNMKLAGYHDLSGRPAYHPEVQQQGNKWILYVAHHVGYATNPLNGSWEPNGTSILDVTDPSTPKLLHHIPGLYEPGQEEARHARICQVGDKFYLLRTSGQRSHDIYDVTDPANPVFKLSILSGGQYTHKPFWDCRSGFATLPWRAPGDGWRANYVKIYYLGDPLAPVFVRDFGLVGQEPGSSGPIPTSIHHGIGSKNGDRWYFGWGSGGSGITQITDFAKLVQGPWPIPPTPANLLYPQLGRIDMPPQWGSHTVFELKGVEVPDFEGTDKVHDFAAVVSEATGWKCLPQRDITFILDITDPTKPYPVANYQVPASEGDFCNKGGRFGPHSTQERFDGPFYKKLLAIAYFNAGIRMVDIRDPFRPVEVAHFIPQPNQNTRFCATVGGVQVCDYYATQTNNADTDTRGLIYTVDRAGTGTHIFELTGDAKKILDE